MSVPHPVVQDVPGVRDTVRFVRGGALEQLPVPWPRCQDIPANGCAQPEKDDFIIAVSHAWPYQAHPDPLGEKRQVLRALTEQACAAHAPRGRTLFFIDFLSTPQHPFAQGQAPRTPAGDEAFATALKVFPLIYLMADATIHLDVEVSQVPEDMHPYRVGTSELRGVQLLTVGPCVQVVDFEPSGAVAPFDIVASISNTSVKTVADVDRFRNAAPWPPALLGCQGCRKQDLPAVEMHRAPFGRRNRIPADVKGWIFLERFVSMVKVAMVPEGCAASVAFSNSAAVLKQIAQGGARLRAAHAGGREALAEVLRDFAKELDTKEFAVASMDKVLNTGGVGGTRQGHAGGGGGASAALNKVGDSAYAPSDREVVWELMQLLVRHLREHWEREAAAQRQRHLTLAVCRGNVVDVVQLIEAGADPNAPDLAGHTSLHTAASFPSVDMVRTLLHHRADTAAEDRLGNLPVHLLSLISRDSTVELFDLLAPSRRELAKPNVAGVSPLKKFARWLEVECRASPFPPAQKRLEELRSKYGDVLLMPAPGTVTRASLSLEPASKGVAHCAVGERCVSIPVWEPAGGGRPAVHVVYLALQSALPWSLTEPAVNTIAECVCHKFRAKIWVVNVEALDTQVLAAEAPLSRLLDDVEAILRALPIGGRFFLLDSSAGMALPVVWRVPELLRGALVVNASMFFSDEFEGSQLHGLFTKLSQEQLRIARARDHEQQGSAHAKFSTADCPEEMAARHAEYVAAWAAAADNTWLWWAYVNLDIMAAARVYRTLPPLPTLPVTFAVGSLAPVLFTHEPVSRFQQILPNSKVAYIPGARQLWDFEGEGPVCKVAALMSEVIASGLGKDNVVHL